MLVHRPLRRLVLPRRGLRLFRLLLRGADRFLGTRLALASGLMFISAVF